MADLTKPELAEKIEELTGVEVIVDDHTRKALVEMLEKATPEVVEAVVIKTVKIIKGSIVCKGTNYAVGDSVPEDVFGEGEVGVKEIKRLKTRGILG